MARFVPSKSARLALIRCAGFDAALLARVEAIFADDLISQEYVWDATGSQEEQDADAAAWARDFPDA